MKQVLIAIIFAAMPCLAMSQVAPEDMPKPTKHTYTSDRKFDDCTFKGQYMDKVKVRIVYTYNSHTFKVRQVEHSEDLTVRFVKESTASNCCGQWYIVESGEDFTVAFVGHGEDFTVRITDIY